jgi:hypothetical protein
VSGLPTSLDELRAIAEAVADLLEERGLVVMAPPVASARVLDAAAVAALLGRDRQWVYAHATELGAFRYGDGPRARLGFDSHAVERWKRGRQGATAAPQKRGARSPSSRPLVRDSALIPYEGSGRGR